MSSRVGQSERGVQWPARGIKEEKKVTISFVDHLEILLR